MHQPELREPNLPASARRANTTLRKGFTTGSCAAAAAKAAAIAWTRQASCQEVSVAMPRSDTRHVFAVKSCEVARDRASAVVVKDAGDDPDVTHGAELCATVGSHPGAGVHLYAGEGVGVVTKPGLGLAVGAPAINDAPREQITAAVCEVLGTDHGGVCVIISVAGGEKMARRTTNPRLGIKGGISILGTTGIVRPFSTAAWRASVGQAIDVLAAQKQQEFVLTTGGRTERAAMALLPHLAEVAFIEVGDFTGFALKRGAGCGHERCFFVGMAGKLAKLAAGVMMTHWTRSKVDAQLLCQITAEAGASKQLCASVAACNTARHAYELWRAAQLDSACDLLCSRAADNLARYIDRRLEVCVLMVDFDDLSLAGKSPGAIDHLHPGALE